LSAKEVFAIAKKLFTSLFGQPLAFAKVVTPKILDHDAATPFVVFPVAKTPRQIEVRQSKRMPRLPRIGFDQLKAAEPVVYVIPILDDNSLSFPFWDFDRSGLSVKVFGLVAELAVKLGTHPSKPVQISRNYFGQGFALVFSESHHGPKHLFVLSCC
jgi:hypothetical protein